MGIEKNSNKMIGKEENQPVENKESIKNCEIVSPIPEWNENIHKIVVGYH